MRELYRTDEGTTAWRNPATDAQSRRLLGALVQAQPEDHLKLVLGSEGEILLESLLRRGWVSWREIVVPPVSLPQTPEIAPPSTTPPAPSGATSAPGAAQSAPVGISHPVAPNSPGHALPPVKPPPAVTKEEVDNSLADFFRKMGSHP